MIPYGWQAPQAQILLPSSSHHRRINVLGFLQRNNRFSPYLAEGTVCGETVIACIDALPARFVLRLALCGLLRPQRQQVLRQHLAEVPDFSLIDVSGQHAENGVCGILRTGPACLL